MFKLCVITERNEMRDHLEIAERAVSGGASAIQFRDKQMNSREMLENCLAIRKFCSKFIVNDRIDIALASNADGVHLGREDMPIEYARKFFEGIIGLSAKNMEEALDAEKKGADYIGVGPVFQSQSKAGEQIGLEDFERICNGLKKPVIGIGGITAENAKSVIEAGAYGIAVISTVSRAKDIEREVERLLRIIDTTI